MTHTEYVHIMLGWGMAITGMVWLLADTERGRGLRWVWPVLVFLIGFFLFIPTETQERSYTQVGAWDTFLSVFPNSLAVWLETVQKHHVIQHKTAGVCAMLAGGVEFGRATGALKAARWAWFLPLLSIGAGLAIGIHGGTQQHLPRVTEQLHHWIMGGALVVGGGLLALSKAGRLKSEMWPRVLPGLMVVAGVDFLLFYRLP